MTEYLVSKSAQKTEILPIKVFQSPDVLRGLLHPLRWRIMMELGPTAQYPKELARRLGVDEQKVYYHIKKLETQGFIKAVGTSKKRGATATHYRAENTNFAIITPFRNENQREGLPFMIGNGEVLLRPFVSSGGVEGFIIVGHPDPHGNFKQRARDTHNAIDIGVFLGSLSPLSRRLIAKLDTEVDERALRSNLIVIGGPRVNTVTLGVNEHLPIRFEKSREYHGLISNITGKTYEEDEVGVVEVITNPANNEARMMVLAGNSTVGTRAAVVALIKRLEEVSKGNAFQAEVAAKVVSGLDLDADGVVDDVEFLE